MGGATDGDDTLTEDNELDDQLEQLIEKKVEERLQRHLQEQQEDDASEDRTEADDNTVTRRKFLKTVAGGAAGLSMLGIASGFQIRSPNDFSYVGGSSKAFNVDTSGNLTASSIDLGGGSINNFAGNNLSIDGSGNLNAADTRIDVENTDGSPLVQNASAIHAGTDLQFSDDGDGSATLDYVGSSGSGTSAPVYVDPNTSFEYIKMGPGEVFDHNHASFDLTDGGTWSNKLIDITADGAGMACDVYFNNFTVENIAVIGVNESGSVDGTFRTQVTDSAATGTFRNIWLGHGGGGGTYSNGNGRTGIFVFNDHAGTLTLDGLYLSQFSNNGVYGSDPGKDSADPGYGVVHIKNSYAERCDVTGFRLGTDGSSFTNCVVNGGYAQGFRADEGGNIDADWCGSTGTRLPGFVSNTSTTFNLTNCRAQDQRTGGSGTFNGSPDPYPKSTPPSGCPRTPNEALSGMRFQGWNI